MEVLKLKLELGYVNIHDIQFADQSKVEAGVLYVCKEDIKNLVLEDENIKSVELEIAKPGDSIRIMPVKDVIEPRCKVEGPGDIFPGVISKVDTVGSGKTNVLRGSAVVTTGKIVAFQEGIIDMSGEGAKYTPFSQTNNLVVVIEPVDGMQQHEHEKAVRFAGLKTAKFLGELAKNVTPDETEVFETYGVKEGMEKMPNLPRVAYVQMLQSQGLMHDTYVYGVDAKRTLSTIMNPTEGMDGAILSGNCGMILTNENVYLADKQRSSDWTAKLCRWLDLDGAVVSQEGFGNPDTDLIMNCKKIEEQGVKTVIITDEYAGQDGKSQSLADADPKADAVVTGGNANMVIHLPKLDKVIGYPEVANIIAGGHEGSLNADGSIDAELQVITGATNELGFNKLSAR